MIPAMQLLFDPRDDPYHQKYGSRILDWLVDLDAIPLDEAMADTEGYLFAGARPIDDYRTLVANFPLVRDRPVEREPLLRLDSVLSALDEHGVKVPMPRTWVLPLDAPLPADISFPLFVRTAESSWKKGGRISRVRNPKELEEEAFALRRALGWDAMIVARQWLELAVAGEGTYGPLPREVRVWIVDGLPFAWTFHYMNLIPKPAGFPPSADDLSVLHRQAEQVGAAFRSRLVVADFARGVDGGWWFIEAGPGSCAGTNHEAVFKGVARRLQGREMEVVGDMVGGAL
jgi:hypothetical protein